MNTPSRDKRGLFLDHICRRICPVDLETHTHTHTHTQTAASFLHRALPSSSEELIGLIHIFLNFTVDPVMVLSGFAVGSLSRIYL